MSCYIPAGGKLNANKLEGPAFFKSYIEYLHVIRNLTDDTVLSYYLQLRLFLRFLKCQDEGGDITEERLKATSIDDMTFSMIERVEAEDIYNFLSFSKSVLQNDARSRSLKISTIKSFFSYFYNVTDQLPKDPASKIELPKLDRPVPRYLTLDECEKLLKSISGRNVERDYCIILLLLSCGMRISEMVKLNLNDIHEDNLLLHGKGRKERVVYLNSACVSAIRSYLRVRATYKNIIDRQALFVTEQAGKRITTRRIEQIVQNALTRADLSGKGISPHKLRHTAATLMYQSGAADILKLQQILGHEEIATTELYTHLEQTDIKDAMLHSPIGGLLSSDE